MIPALQAIRIADEYEMISDTLAGKKTVTIREGHRDYQVGVAIVVCVPANYCAEVDIISVVHTTLAQVDEKDLADDGFSGRGDALRQLQRFYPKLEMKSPITVIRWANIRGRAVDDYPYNL